jgi:hypothetical protein
VRGAPESMNGLIDALTDIATPYPHTQQGAAVGGSRRKLLEPGVAGDS